MEKEKVNVIYITGEGRSGSTLLERILGQHPEIFAAGELIHIWERGFIENQLCSCKLHFKDCPVWKNIVKTFQRYISNIDIQSIIDAFKKSARIRHYLLKQNLNNPYSQKLNQTYYALYKAILDTTGKKFVVDASKHPVFAHILAQNKNINLYILHLIRKPEGVAYSWTKKKKRPEITDRIEYMPRYSIIRTSVSWSTVNKIASDLQKLNHVKYYKILYEDLVSNPLKVLTDLYNFLDLKFNQKSLFIKSDTLMLKENHTVAGNPFRFKTGTIKLSLDEEWKYRLPFWKKCLINLLTLPVKRSIYK